MRHYTFIILTSCIAAVGSILLIAFRTHIGDPDTVRTVAYLAVPLGLGGALAWTNRNAFAGLTKLLVATIAYTTIMTLLEPLAYRFWIVSMTPAGGSYSSYDLHAIFPVPGVLFVPVAFLLNLLIAFLWAAIRTIARMVDRMARGETKII